VVKGRYLLTTLYHDWRRVRPGEPLICARSDNFELLKAIAEEIKESFIAHVIDLEDVPYADNEEEVKEIIGFWDESQYH